MTDETATATETTTTEANPTKAAPKPRAPKLTATFDGVEHPLLKYPFPVKAPRFNVNVNGVACEAATTGGRGKEYTYILINNTSFYVPGVVSHDAEVSVAFPDDYAFDTTVTERKSYYKPKKAKEGDECDTPNGADAGDGAATDGAQEAAGDTADAATTEANPPKAARRRK